MPQIDRTSLSRWSQHFVADVRFAFRMLVSHPAFSVGAVATLAAGIAAATLVFTVFNGLFLDSLPYPEADRLVFLHETSAKRTDLGIAWADFSAWRAGNRTFANMALYQENSGSLGGFGEAIRINGATVSYGLAATFGIKPVLGRDFGPEDDRPGGPRVLLLGYRIWQTRFGGSARIIGTSIQLDDDPWTVVGILPEVVVFPAGSDYWIPAGIFFDNPGNGYVLDGVGLLKAGVTLEGAQQDLVRVHKSMAGERPRNKETRPVVMSLRERCVGKYRLLMRALLAGIGFLLAIACANVAGLTIARGTGRSREVAVRTALGATRARVVAQLVTESAVLAAIANAAGAAAGFLAVRSMVRSAPDVLPSWVRFHFDIRLMLFSVAVTGMAAVLAGLGPALRLSKDNDLRSMLAAGGRSATFSRRHGATMRTLVVLEIALASFLSINGALLVRTLTAMLNTDPGFRIDNVFTFSLNPPYAEGERRQRYYERILTELRRTPGIRAAGAADWLPPDDPFKAKSSFQSGDPGATQNNELSPVRVVTQEYFSALGIELKAGREFNALDPSDSVVVVNEAFARLFWPSSPSALGRSIKYAGSRRPMTVIGIARNVRNNGLDQAAQPCVYLLYGQRVPGYMSIAVHSDLDSHAVLASARRAAAQAEPGLALFDAQSMGERLRRPLWLQRASSWLLGLFSLTALTLAVAGLYAIVSYSVAQRSRELAIRMALGADGRQIVMTVLREGVQLVAVGLAIGLAAVWLSARPIVVLVGSLYTFDSLTCLAVVAVLLSAAFLANLTPALRAASRRPATALGVE